MVSWIHNKKVPFPYEYIDGWKKFNETSLTEKEDFHSHLNMEDITDVDYAQKKEFVKKLNKK